MSDVKIKKIHTAVKESYEIIIVETCHRDCVELYIIKPN